MKKIVFQHDLSKMKKIYMTLTLSDFVVDFDVTKSKLGRQFRIFQPLLVQVALAYQKIAAQRSY